jgi:hypothetical protein
MRSERELRDEIIPSVTVRLGVKVYLPLISLFQRDH